MLNFSLSDEQTALRDKVRDFAIKEILPIAWEFDERDEIPVVVLKKAFENGIMNSDIPKQYGGKGYGIVEGVIMTEEIAAACPGLATSIFDNSLGLEPLVLSDKESLKKKYLTKIANEFKLICFATSEPVMGSDVSGIRCAAEKTDNGYRLNGTKYWITNGGIADYMTVFATIDPKSAHKGICAFLVEKEWDGVRIGSSIPKMGQRCSNTVGLHFDNVEVPEENIIAHPGEGFVLAMKTFSRTRPVIGAFAVGAARSAMEYAIDYAKKRQAFGTKISNFQTIQFKLAEMYQKIETSRLLTLKAAWEADTGIDPTINASLAKFYASESAMEVVDEAMQIMGGYGYTKMFPLEKLFRDIRLLKIYEGTSEVQRLIVSGHALSSYEPVMPSLADLPMMKRLTEAERSNADVSGINAWRCRMCGHIHSGDEPPEECLYCFFPKTAFKELVR